MLCFIIKTPVGPVEYTIKRRTRVKKRLHMELDEDGGLVIVAPGHWSSAQIKETLAQNTGHVARFLSSARQRHTTALKYVDRERHLYLGNPYALSIQHVSAGQDHITLADAEIHINTSVLMLEKIQTSLQNWYLKQAITVLGARLEAMTPHAPWLGNKKIKLKLRRMKRTWGSCSTKAVIQLNTHLIKAPLTVIDSVIAHELCHLQEMNHGKVFYSLLEGLNPHWRRDRQRLRSEAHLYLRQ